MLRSFFILDMKKISMGKKRYCNQKENELKLKRYLERIRTSNIGKDSDTQKQLEVSKERNHVFKP